MRSSVLFAVALAAAAAAMAMAMAPSIHAKTTDCTVEVEKMQPCLAFVQDQINIPSSSCCKALMSVHLDSPVCLCQLLSSGAASSAAAVNITSALLLPKICNVHTDPTRCPALLAGAPEGTISPPSSTGADSSENPSSASPALVWSWLVVAASQIVLLMETN